MIGDGDKEDKAIGLDIFDEMDLLSKFVMEPNLPVYGFDKEKFKHHNKTWFTTNTDTADSHFLRLLSENIQLLNTFNKEVIRMVPVSYDKENAKIIYTRKLLNVNRFNSVIDIYMDKISSINMSSAGRYAAVLKLMRSIIQKQDQTLEDKSYRSSFLGRFASKKKQ